MIEKLWLHKLPDIMMIPLYDYYILFLKIL